MHIVYGIDVRTAGWTGYLPTDCFLFWVWDSSELINSCALHVEHIATIIYSSSCSQLSVVQEYKAFIDYPWYMKVILPLNSLIYAHRTVHIVRMNLTFAKTTGQSCEQCLCLFHLIHLVPRLIIDLNVYKFVKYHVLWYWIPQILWNVTTAERQVRSPFPLPAVAQVPCSVSKGVLTDLLYADFRRWSSIVERNENQKRRYQVLSPESVVCSRMTICDGSIMNRFAQRKRGFALRTTYVLRKRLFVWSADRGASLRA